MHRLLVASDGATDRLQTRLYEGRRMDKAKEIDLRIQQVIDALLKLGAIGVGTPQLVEIKTSDDGYFDLPVKVRFAV